MPISARKAQLTAINEAIRCLDYDCLDGTDPRTDELVSDAMDALLDARSRLTPKPWPEQPSFALDEVAFEEWLEARAYEQQSDGRR